MLPVMGHTDNWEVELHLGPFLAISDQKGLKGHLKVRGSEGEENEANAGGMEDSRASPGTVTLARE